VIVANSIKTRNNITERIAKVNTQVGISTNYTKITPRPPSHHRPPGLVKTQKPSTRSFKLKMTPVGYGSHA